MPTNLTGVKAIDSGWYHNLALKTNGTVVAWGANLYGQATVPTGLSNVTAIAAGAEHNLALKADGTVVGWGWYDVGQASPPAGLSNVVGIAAGGSHSLALKRDGTVTAWGLNTSGQCTVPTGLSNVMAVAAGWAHSAALKNDGTLVSWGSHSDGQTNVPGWLADVKLLTAGGNQTAASVFSPLAQYPVDVSRDLLLIYNTNSLDSSNVCAYYLAHRPLVSSANVLGIGCVTNETAYPAEFTNQIVGSLSAWMQTNPTKRPQYMVLFPDIPSRVNWYSNGPPGVYWVVGASPSVQYRLHTFTQGWRPFVTSINMGGTNDCAAYIAKLAWCGSNSPGQLLLSASAWGYGNTNYVVDNVRHAGPTPYFEDYSSNLAVSSATNGLLTAGVPPGGILFTNGLETCIECRSNVVGGMVVYSCGSIQAQPHLTRATNVAGYICWGAHSSLGWNYALNTNVAWSGNSRWYIVETVESYNGVRINNSPLFPTWQATFLQWFSSSAFGGSDYSSTPAGAVSHVDEPGGGGANDSAIYFGLWSGSKTFASSAWNSRKTDKFQAVGDPLIKR